MIIKHHNETFKNDTLVLNNTGYIDCTFTKCRLCLVNEPDDFVLLDSCEFKDCELIGEGWNYGFVEAWQNHVLYGKPLEWQGPIGNGNVTKH
jgi:hypothetical protein